MRLWLFLFYALLVLPAAAPAEERLALVIGNGAYEAIGPLDNPPVDARLIHDTLTGQGFDARLVLDADQETLQREVADFGRRLGLAGPDAVGLFYFAGHGVQADGRNFLMPVEAAPDDVMELEITAVEVDWLMRIMERAGNRTNIVILDACRNNPFVAKSRAASRGLARVNAPTGSFIAYATAPGGVATDGDGENSPFSAALARAMQTPGKTIEQVFKQVRIDVLRATGGKQTPWDSSSLVNDFYFSGMETEAAPAEASLWASIGESQDPGRLSLFLQVYPQSVYAPEARARLARILARETDEEAGRGGAAPKEEAPAETAENGASGLEAEALRFEQARKTGTVAAYEAFLEEYPDGVFADLARMEVSTRVAADPDAKPAPKKEDEAAAFETARAAGTSAAYETFLESYPDGIFADLARMEVANLAAAAPAADAPEPAPAAGPILFTSALRSEDPAIDGQSIEALSHSSPLFPPVEGLPESYWKGQKCQYCHNWTQQALCDQGDFYRTRDDASPERIRHPFGGAFKRSLAQWAEEGCN